MASTRELVVIAGRDEHERHRVTQLPVLVVHVHSSCNCRCLMCDIWKTKESRAFRPADLTPHLESIRRLGVRWVVFSGGEPLLNRELPELCSILRREGIRLTLLTTGLLLERQAAQVAECFDDAIVSLDGPEPIHNAVRRIDTAFALIQSGRRALKKQRPAFPVTARTTVQKANHRNLRETLVAAKQLDLDGVSFLAADLMSAAFNRTPVWSAERQGEIGLSPEELGVLEVEIEALICEYSADIANGYIAESPEKLRRIAGHFRAHLGLARSQSPQCNAPWTSAVIETDGTVRPCFFHQAIGNIGNASLEEVINGEAALAFRSALHIPSNPTCNRCVCSLNYRS
jgi:MoaA/NifB/PqqE/SkfB family radical SAM enzyme